MRKAANIIFEILFYLVLLNFVITGFIDAWKNDEYSNMKIMKRTPQHFFWNFKK